MTNDIKTQDINEKIYVAQQIKVAVLRLDGLHPVVSGNKYFKLRFYLQDVLAKGFGTVATFGGAFSNHIVAAAFACAQAGLQSVGYIRGEEPRQLSHTLQHARSYGMQLVFLSREAYKNRQTIIEQNSNCYWIEEGGYGIKGAEGAATISTVCNSFKNYTHIVCATGTGTMMAGLIKASLPHQKVVGICVLKGYENMEADVRKLLNEAEQQKHFEIIHGYHFGGYAKSNTTLIDYMNDVWQQHLLPLDFVYTAKAFYALNDLVAKNYFPEGGNVLFIHSGGLQGNYSLNKDILSFL